MLAPAECYTTIGARSGKIRTTIVLHSCAEILNQEEKQKLFFSLLCYTAKKEEKREARVFLLSHKMTAQVPTVVPTPPVLKPLYTFLNISHIRVSSAP